MKIVKIILDVMSPAQQTIVDLVEILNGIEGVAQVEVSLTELEKNVEDLKVTLEGYGLDYEIIRSAIRDFGGVVRNVDNIVSAEEYISKQDSDKLSASMLVLARHSDAKLGEIEQIYDEFDKMLTFVRSKKM